MESVEVLVWVFFVLAAVVFNLVQSWQRKARRRIEQAQDAAARTPAAEPAAAAPSGLPPRGRAPLGTEAWGRGAEQAESLETLEPLGGPVPPHEAPRPEVPVPAAPPHVPAEAPHAPAAMLPPGQRPSHQRPFRTAAEVRHAVVAMTVLGPCRALEPHDTGKAEPPRT